MRNPVISTSLSTVVIAVLMGCSAEGLQPARTGREPSRLVEPSQLDETASLQDVEKPASIDPRLLGHWVVPEPVGDSDRQIGLRSYNNRSEASIRIDPNHWATYTIFGVPGVSELEPVGTDGTSCRLRYAISPLYMTITVAADGHTLFARIDGNGEQESRSYKFSRYTFWKGKYRDGQPEGDWCEVRVRTGKSNQKGRFANGRKHGRWVMYNSVGEESLVHQYRNGKRTSVSGGKPVIYLK